MNTATPINHHQPAKPIIPWAGGKRRLTKYLLPLMPEHTCYVELFAGGAALLYAKDKSKVEVINDINGELVNLYRIIQHHFDEFVRQFDGLLTSRDSFYQLKNTPPESLTDIQRAARFYYLQHTVFGAKCTGQNFGTATTSPSFDITNIAQNLRAARKRLARVYIENEPWQQVLKRYDRPHTFFYADPPYWSLAGYGVAFGWNEYEQLAAAMKTMQGKMMLSINDCPEIRELFKDFNIKEVSLAYTVSKNVTKRQPSSELIIGNY